MIELSLNQATTRPYGLQDTAEAMSARDVRHIGLWLEPVAEIGIRATRQVLKDNALSITSMCRTGFVADKAGADFRRAVDDVRGAIDVCYEVGAPQLTFIAGGFPSRNRDTRTAEGRVREALELLEPAARQAGVRLALEPLHPLFVDDRSMVTTIAQGLRVMDGLPAESIGLLLDTYATYWDPDFHASVAAAGERIAGYQVNDFSLPLPAPEHMNGRLFPGEGHIDLPALTASVRRAGFMQPIEVEIFNEAVWRLPLAQILDKTIDTFARSIAEPLSELEGVS